MTAWLSRDAILSANDIVIEKVDVPEWGGTVCVRSMSGAARERLEQLVAKQSLTRAFVVAMTVCDETGTLLFSEADIEALSGKSANALNRVFEVGARMSRIGDEADSGNLPAAQGGGNGTESQRG